MHVLILASSEKVILMCSTWNTADLGAVTKKQQNMNRWRFLASVITNHIKSMEWSGNSKSSYHYFACFTNL